MTSIIAPYLTQPLVSKILSDANLPIDTYLELHTQIPIDRPKIVIPTVLKEKLELIHKRRKSYFDGNTVYYDYSSYRVNESSFLAIYVTKFGNQMRLTMEKLSINYYAHELTYYADSLHVVEMFTGEEVDKVVFDDVIVDDYDVGYDSS